MYAVEATRCLRIEGSSRHRQSLVSNFDREAIKFLDNTLTEHAAHAVAEENLKDDPAWGSLQKENESLRQQLAAAQTTIENYKQVAEDKTVTIFTLNKSVDDLLVKLKEREELLEKIKVFLWNPDENANERFERIGKRFYKETLFLRPGKSDPEKDTSSPENVKRFDDWYENKFRELCAAYESRQSGEEKA